MYNQSMIYDLKSPDFLYVGKSYDCMPYDKVSAALMLFDYVLHNEDWIEDGEDEESHDNVKIVYGSILPASEASYGFGWIFYNGHMSEPSEDDALDIGVENFDAESGESVLAFLQKLFADRQVKYAIKKKLKNCARLQIRVEANPYVAVCSPRVIIRMTVAE